MGLFAVIGPGAVGSAIALNLRFGHLQYVLIGRQGIRSEPLTITFGGKTFELAGLKASDFQWPKVAGAFICVKAYDLERALAVYAPLLPAGALVVVTANGAVDQIYQQACQSFPQLHWRLGIAQLGARENATGIEVVGDGGVVSIGAMSARSEISSVEQQLQQASPKFFRPVVDIMPIFRKKWLVNVVANSFAGAHCLARNRLLLDHQDELRAVFAEAVALSNERWGAWSASSDQLWQDFVGVLHALADNENSMARDVRLGRPTETNFLAGLAMQYAGYPRLKALHRVLSHT